MKKIFETLGTVFIVGSIVFLLINSFIVTGSSDEDFSRDLFGLPIPHPPVWTSYIPFLGGFLGFIFEYFSLHGLVGLGITVILFGIGSFLLSLADKRKKLNETI